MDVYVVEGDYPSVAVAWDKRGALTVMHPDGRVTESWCPPDPGARIASEDEREAEYEDAVEEAKDVGRQYGRDGLLRDLHGSVDDVLDGFEDRVEESVLNDIRTRLTEWLDEA